MENIRARIEQEVGSWEGVSVHPHRFGGVEFRLGRRELGHLHESVGGPAVHTPDPGDAARDADARSLTAPA